MIRLSVEDLVYEVKEELMCYEQLGEEKALDWERGFRLWLRDKGSNKKNIIEKNGKQYYCMEDESAVFDIADEYLEAVENGSETVYWKKFW